MKLTAEEDRRSSEGRVGLIIEQKRKIKVSTLSLAAVLGLKEQIKLTFDSRSYFY